MVFLEEMQITMDLTTNSVGLSLSHHALIILSDRPSSLSQSQLMLNYDTQVTKDHVPQRQFNYCCMSFPIVCDNILNKVTKRFLR